MADCASRETIFFLEVTNTGGGIFDGGTTILTTENAQFGTEYIATISKLLVRAARPDNSSLVAEVLLAPAPVAPGTYPIEKPIGNDEYFGVDVNGLGAGPLTGTFAIEQLTTDVSIAPLVAMWFEAEGSGMHLRGCVRYRYP